MTSPLTILSPGTTLEGFVIEDVAGSGGMAVVYRARQRSLGRTVALKVLGTQLAGDPTFRERFRREAETVASLDHPNLVPVYAFGEVQDHPYIAMRYVGGGTLAEVIARRGLTAGEALAVLGAVAGALDAARAVGVLHRDVKPQNILLSQDGHAYLTDFGIAKAADASRLTEPGGFLGSVHYVAPEQIRGAEITGRTDVYSLAVVAYECFTGAGPYAETDGAGLIDAHLFHAPVPLEPREDPTAGRLDAALRAGVAKEPELRPETATAFVESLREALAGADAVALGLHPAFPAAHRPAPLVRELDPGAAATTEAPMIVGGGALGLGAGRAPGSPFSTVGSGAFVWHPAGAAERAERARLEGEALARREARRAALRIPAVLLVVAAILPLLALAYRAVAGPGAGNERVTAGTLSFERPGDDAFAVTKDATQISRATNGAVPATASPALRDTLGIVDRANPAEATFGATVVPDPDATPGSLAVQGDTGQEPTSERIAVDGGTMRLYRTTVRGTGAAVPGVDRLWAVGEAGTARVVAACTLQGTGRETGRTMCLEAIRSMRVEGETIESGPDPAIARGLVEAFAPIRRTRGDAFLERRPGPRVDRAREVITAYEAAVARAGELANQHPRDGELRDVSDAVIGGRRAFEQLEQAAKDRDAEADEQAREAVTAADQELATALRGLRRRGYDARVTQ